MASKYRLPNSFSDLPIELLQNIYRSLSFVDLVKGRLVCVNWSINLSFLIENLSVVSVNSGHSLYCGQANHKTDKCNDIAKLFKRAGGRFTRRVYDRMLAKVLTKICHIKALYLTDVELTPNSFGLIQEHCTSIECLTLTDIKMPIKKLVNGLLTFTCKNGRRIKHLQLSVHLTSEYEDGLGQMLSFCPNLKILTAENFGYTLTSQSIPKRPLNCLTSLSLIRGNDRNTIANRTKTNIEINAVTVITLNSPLERLALSGITQSIFDVICSNLPNLTQIDLDWDSSDNFPGDWNAISKLSKLRSLSLYCMSYSTRHSLGTPICTITKGCPNLEQLTVFGQMSDKGLEAIIENCPRLTRLILENIKSPRSVSEKSVTLLSGLTNLIQLHLINTDITDFSANIIIEGCKELRILRMRKCGKVTVDIFSYFRRKAKTCPQSSFTLGLPKPLVDSIKNGNIDEIPKNMILEEEVFHPAT